MDRSTTGVVLGALVAIAALRASGAATPLQSTSPVDGPTFEVASIKPNTSGEPTIRFGLQPGGRFTASNVPVRELIRFAYQVQLFQIVGAPGWVASERFDVTAKAEGPLPPMVPDGPPGPLQLMMRALLAERFKLAVHTETRESPVFALTLGRRDGRLGPSLTPSTVDCAAMLAARGGGPPPPPSPTGPPPCGLFMGPGSLRAGGATIAQLAGSLGPRLNRVVVDKTGLTGRYDFTLEFTPDQLRQLPGGAAGDPPPAPPDGPSLSTALQEQLGLKLESQRGPVEMLVVDAIERPTPD